METNQEEEEAKKNCTHQCHIDNKMKRHREAHKHWSNVFQNSNKKLYIWSPNYCENWYQAPLRYAFHLFFSLHCRVSLLFHNLFVLTGRLGKGKFLKSRTLRNKNKRKLRKRKSRWSEKRNNVEAKGVYFFMCERIFFELSLLSVV